MGPLKRFTSTFPEIPGMDPLSEYCQIAGNAHGGGALGIDAVYDANQSP